MYTGRITFERSSTERCVSATQRWSAVQEKINQESVVIMKITAVNTYYVRAQMGVCRD